MGAREHRDTTEKVTVAMFHHELTCTELMHPMLLVRKLQKSLQLSTCM